MSFCLMKSQMIRVISSPSISTTGFSTLIFAISVSSAPDSVATGYSWKHSGRPEGMRRYTATPDRHLHNLNRDPPMSRRGGEALRERRVVSLRFGFLALLCLFAMPGGLGTVDAATFDPVAAQRAGPVAFLPVSRASDGVRREWASSGWRTGRLLWSVDCPAVETGRYVPCDAPDIGAMRTRPPATDPLPRPLASALAAVVLSLFWATAFRPRLGGITASSRSSAVRRSP